MRGGKGDVLTSFLNRWIGQDLSKYGPDDDLRLVGTPPLQAVSDGDPLESNMRLLLVRC